MLKPASLLGVLSVLACGVSFAVASGQTAKTETARPDFTGVWTNFRDPGAPRGPAFSRPPRGDISDLPLTDEAKSKIADYRKLVGDAGDAPGAHCVGTGMPGSMSGSGGYPMEIIQRPDQITVVYEAHNEMRRIYLGSRIIPEADRLPDRNGVSSARWEGNTLVVDITDLKEQVDQHYAHSDQARITERYHIEKDSKGGRVLVNDWVMTDPFYTKPVAGQKKWSEVPNGHLLPYDCPEQGWIEHLEELRNPSAAAKSKYY